MGITQLGYVGLGVTDLDRWEDFASRILGLQVSERAPDGSLYLRMDDYHWRIRLHPADEDDLLYAGWQVAMPQDLADLRARLAAAGTTVTEGTAAELAERKVKGLLKFRDPSGTPFEAFYGPVVKPGVPCVPGRPITGFRAAEQGVGHLVLFVNDRDACERFYLDVMGLKLTDYGSAALAFFHCNPRHHSLAILQPRTAPPRRLNHLMLEVLSLDDVGTGYDLVQAEGIPVSRTLGKHVNDHMVSFYMESPSGFEVEIGWGGRQVDDATWTVESYDRGDVWGHHRLPRPATPPSEPAAAGAARA